jgi:hypothetical protein
MLKWLRRFILLMMLLTLLIANVLTITSTAFNAALTGLVATAIGVKTVTSKLHAQVASQKSSVRTTGRNLAARTKRIAAYSVAEIPASVIPFAGMALLVAGTAWELKQLCDGLKDMEALYAQMQIEEDLDGDTLRAVCHPHSWFKKRSTLNED